MVKRATVRAMSPTASSRLLKCRWSTAPRRHSQPEMVARGVINKKHTMSPNRVRFSCWGPGFLSHCGEERQTKQVRRGVAVRGGGHTILKLPLSQDLGKGAFDPPKMIRKNVFRLILMPLPLE